MIIEEVDAIDIKSEYIIVVKVNEIKENDGGNGDDDDDDDEDGDNSDNDNDNGDNNGDNDDEDDKVSDDQIWSVYQGDAVESTDRQGPILEGDDTL